MGKAMSATEKEEIVVEISEMVSELAPLALELDRWIASKLGGDGNMGMLKGVALFRMARAARIATSPNPPDMLMAVDSFEIAVDEYMARVVEAKFRELEALKSGRAH